VLSLLAFHDQQPVGHILLTRSRLEPESTAGIYLLAPLAVISVYQKQRIGGDIN
jgi:putative acetyltransferase